MQLPQFVITKNFSLRRASITKCGRMHAVPCSQVIPLASKATQIECAMQPRMALQLENGPPALLDGAKPEDTHHHAGAGAPTGQDNDT
eukprot:9817288-Lingulodinium_polyedra.AAC.1